MNKANGTEVDTQELAAFDAPSAPVGPDAVKERARRLAADMATLAQLDPAAFDKVTSAFIGQHLVGELAQQVNLAGIDIAAEKEAFLAAASRTRSVHTARAYRSALAYLDDYAEKHGIEVLAMKAKDADDFTSQLTLADGKAPATVRLIVAACSSFFTWLERRHETIRSPFRGTRARPAKQSTRKAAYPDASELAVILSALSPQDRAAAMVMAGRGLRIGGLPGLTLKTYDGKTSYTTRSKGKDISGTMPAESVDAIRAGCPSLKRPFTGLSVPALSMRIIRKTSELAEAGTIAAAYSPHDFRHLFAVSEYRRDHDLYRVSRLLGHSSVAVTQIYLEGLGEEVD